MPQLDPPEFLTLSLYATTMSLMVIVLYASAESVRRFFAIVAIGVGALATACLIALYDGRAYVWFPEPAPATVGTQAPAPFKPAPGTRV